MNHDIVCVVRPTPPDATGSERYAGIHPFNPHQPNSAHAFMKVTTTVIFSMLPLNMSEKRLAVFAAAAPPLRSRSFSAIHTSGSSTFLRTHSVKNAGRMPTKNTARQPYLGRMKPTTIAAVAKPIAHELCMKPSARPRCFAGHVSDTSAAPLAHSPPMPRPSNARNTANCQRFCDSPHAAVKTE